MSDIQVKPTRVDCPAHPTAGKLPPDGGPWPADQFTFRRLRDGDIERVKDEVPAKPVPQKQEKPAAE